MARRPSKAPSRGPKLKVLTVDSKGAQAHNGDGRPELQFPDPITGELIGGQVAAVRQAMRYRHVVMPWARRQGKSTTRKILIPNEATITTGPYWFGMVLPDHHTAFKIAQDFRLSWGGMVKDFKINDKDQDRWIELHPMRPPDGPPPAWFTPPMMERWRRCQKGEHNTSVHAHFWSGKHPHYEGIQGDPHPWHRIDWDEVQQAHPLAYGVVSPMLRDVGGSEMMTGTPWSTAIGNVKFEQFWNITLDSSIPDWFGMRVPDGTNPYVPATDPRVAAHSMSEAEIRQTLFAEFLTGAGAVFSNLDNVFVLPPIDPTHPSVAWVLALRSRFALPTLQWWVHHAQPIEGHIYALTIDWARSPQGDWSAMHVFDLSTGHQAAVMRWRGEDFTAQMEMVLAVQQHYGARQLHSDNNGMGLTMGDFLRRRHALGFIAHRWGGKAEPEYVRRAQILFVDADIAMINCAVQRHEFKGFSAFESPTLGGDKRIRYGAPADEHDDIVDSFLMLAQTLTICGRQDPILPPPEAEPMFDDDKRTTLERFAAGLELPWDDESSSARSWNSVVLPEPYRR